MTRRRKGRKSQGLEEYGPRPDRFRRSERRPRQAQFDLRRARAMDLQMQDFPMRVIGQKLHADPAMHTDPGDKYPDGFPGGYGWSNYVQGLPPLQGDALLKAVSRDLHGQLTSARLASETVRQEGLTLKLEQLRMAAAAYWPGVLAGNARSGEVWLAIQDKQIKLMGLEPAEQHLVGIGPAGGPPQPPERDDEWARRVFDALSALGIIPPDTDPLAALNPPAAEAAPDADIVDAEVVDAPAE